MKRINLNFNSEVKEIFKRSQIDLHDGITYLLALYYGTDPSYFPDEFKTKVLSTNILTKDYKTNTYVWNVPLFEEIEIGFEWVSEWMDLFKMINPERRGVKADVLVRMKKFFMNNPAVRKEQVFEATTEYLRTVSNPIYCKKAHKFIYEIDGTSMLLHYVEMLNDRKISNNNNDDVI